MTRFIHDQFAKDYLEELLKPFGEVQAAIDILTAPKGAGKHLTLH